MCDDLCMLCFTPYKLYVSFYRLGLKKFLKLSLKKKNKHTKHSRYKLLNFEKTTGFPQVYIADLDGGVCVRTWAIKEII
jgi:hypothetical protein